MCVGSFAISHRSPPVRPRTSRCHASTTAAWVRRDPRRGERKAGSPAPAADHDHRRPRQPLHGPRARPTVVAPPDPDHQDIAVATPSPDCLQPAISRKPRVPARSQYGPTTHCGVARGDHRTLPLCQLKALAPRPLPTPLLAGRRWVERGTLQIVTPPFPALPNIPIILSSAT